MDSLITARNGSMVDAFTMVLAIQLDARVEIAPAPQRRQVYVRKTMFARRPVALFSSFPKEGAEDGVYLVAEFQQWEGCVRLFGLSFEEIKPFLKEAPGLRMENWPVNYEKLFREVDPRVYSIDELSAAAVESAKFLTTENTRLPVRGLEEYRTTMRNVQRFMKLRGRAGRVALDVDDLGRLLGIGMN